MRPRIVGSEGGIRKCHDVRCLPGSELKVFEEKYLDGMVPLMREKVVCSVRSRIVRPVDALVGIGVSTVVRRPQSRGEASRQYD